MSSNIRQVLSVRCHTTSSWSTLVCTPQNKQNPNSKKNNNPNKTTTKTQNKSLYKISRSCLCCCHNLLWEKDIPIEIIKCSISTLLWILSPLLAPPWPHPGSSRHACKSTHGRERVFMTFLLQKLNAVIASDAGTETRLGFTFAAPAWCLGKLLSSLFSALQSSRKRDVINRLGPWASP